MSPTDKPTLRLVSRYWHDLSAEVDLVATPASASLRRRASRRTLRIPRGGWVDLCKELGVDADEARAIVYRSAQLARYLPPAGQHLVLVEWPPPESVTAPAVMAPAPAPEPEPEPTPDPEPSVEWPRSKLRAYAISLGIMVHNRMSKTQIVDAITEWTRHDD